MKEALEVSVTTHVFIPAARPPRTGPHRSAHDSVAERAVPVRALVVSLFVAVLAAFAVTLATSYRADDVTRETEDIYGRAMPRVVSLATLRERVRHLSDVLSAAVETRSRPSVDFDRLVDGTREEAGHYRLLAGAALGGSTAPTLMRDLEETLRRAERARVLLDDRDFEAATAAALDLRTRAGELDRELVVLVESNAFEGARSAHRIDHVEDTVRKLALVFNAIGAALAMVLGAIAVRTVRRRSALLEAHARELEQFAVRVAHDVRGPLEPVSLALATIVQELPEESRARVAVAVARRSLGRIGLLVDDLLAFARAGGRPEPHGRASVIDTLSTVSDEVRSAAEAADVTLTTVFPDRDFIVRAPPGVLGSLLQNLLRNAIKYTMHSEERRVIVRVAEAGFYARVEIEDTGMGVPSGLESDIFEPYVRADTSGQPGLGIGLATAKRLAEAHGGRVGVARREVGSLFWFELPLWQDVEGPQAP
jgi:signal transduction histidine kinase